MLIAGNWKMHGTQSFTKELINYLVENTKNSENEIAVFPPYPYLSLTCELLHTSSIQFGAQDVSAHDAGAYTGEVSASMLADVGCRYVLIGHSERRAYHHETNELIAEKCQLAHQNKLIPILCIGETQLERDADSTYEIISAQLAPLLDSTFLEHTIIAYEPVWAIGTGKTATPDEAQAVHRFIREKIAKKNSSIGDKIRILYGGSVKASNAAELFSMPDIDGGLIGGASLKKEEFAALCQMAKM